MRTVFIGLMSGTSLDGIDGVAVDFAAAGGFTVLGHANAGFEPALREALVALNSSGDNELHRAMLAANGLSRAYAAVVASLLAEASLSADEVEAIGAHGQTVRHRPGEFDGIGYTVQLGAPALLAELTGIDVVADFRSRDVAAGGQGAPLVPAFHRAAFWRSGEPLAVLNLGGIANLTAITADGAVTGFDCGPANGLLDLWCHETTGAPFDAAGALAARGTVDSRLLDAMLAEPYFARTPPKSTGRDLFHRGWLDAHLDAAGARERLATEGIQATLAELTAATCADACLAHAPAATELVVCGGGAHNVDLMQRLGKRLAPRRVIGSAARGLAPDRVEAAAFAWLAHAAVVREPGNVSGVTGAAGARVLGAIYPRPLTRQAEIRPRSSIHNRRSWSRSDS